MKVIDYFDTENKAHWLAKIGESDWSAGKLLHDLLQEGKMKKLTGKNTKVLLLTDGEELVSFCTLADVDDVQPTDLTPWIGFVYTFRKYRGKRHIVTLLTHAEALAREAGYTHTHISTTQKGLYERYGYTYFQTVPDMHGKDTRVYTKSL